MFCPNCGSPLPDGSRFCTECGATIDGLTGKPIKSSSGWIGTEDLASRWSRLGAAIIDFIIMMAISVPIVIFVGLIDFDDWEATQSIGQQALSTVVSVCLYIAVNGYFLARNGQSVGKLALGIKIVRSNREKASFGRLIGLRYLPVWIITSIPFIGGVIGLVDILLIFREEKNCLHDDIADTRVIVA